MSVQKQPKILILGAGIAGVSAARRLVDAGFEDVIILEAADRIGGRIHTVQFGDGDMPVELGANWIHGPTIENSTFRVTETIGALQPYWLNKRMSSRFMREDGSEIDRKIVKEAIHIYDTVIDNVFCKLPRERINNGRIVTIASLIYECLETELDRLKMNESYIKDMRRAFNVLLNSSRFHEGDELEKVTWVKYQEDYNIPPGGDVLIPGGYVQIFNHLMKPIPKQSLILRCEVVKVNWGRIGDERIKVDTVNGRTFVADHVIVTFSVGYLKRHHETLFTPVLPKLKIDALHSLTLGRVNKIFMEFDKAVLAPSYSSVAFAWDVTAPGADHSKWYKRNFGFDQLFTKKNTVLGWVAGDSAEYMEKLSDEEIAKTCVRLLQKFLGNENIPYPKAVLVSRWCSNPYILGAYFHQTNNLFPAEQTILSEPLTSTSGKPVIMFAGEALANGCTHGARDTGLKQAERLIEFYRKKKLLGKL